jgi:hypothetical protein
VFAESGASVGSWGLGELWRGAAVKSVVSGHCCQLFA